MSAPLVRNVILIVSDTLRRDHLGCYAQTPVRTPHLTAFAQQCLVFDQAYTGSFPTVPCRNDLLTGRYTFTYKPWAPLSPDDVTLPELLRPAGLVTGLIADTPHPFTPGFNYQRGFQSWEIVRGQEHDPWKSYPRTVRLPCAPHKLRNPETTVVQYLRNVHGRQHEHDYFVARTMRLAAEWLEHTYDTPFFLYVDTFDPHEPWDPPRHYVDLYDPGYQGEEVIYPRYDRCDYLTPEELQHCRALYAGEVTLVDRWVGFLLDRVESLGLLQNTAIIFLSDHGFYLGERGYIGKSLIRDRVHQPLPLYPEVAHIPLLIYLPGATPRRVPALAQPVDLLPTILDLLGMAIPPHLQGHSLVPVLTGERAQVREIAVAAPTIAGPHLQAPHPASRVTVTDGEWLLICGCRSAENLQPETTLMVDSIGRQVQILDPTPLVPRLYHRPTDPDCTRDRLAEAPAEAARLHQAFLALLETAGVPAHQRAFFADLT